MKGKRLDDSAVLQLLKYELSKPWSPPSKLPIWIAKLISFVYVSFEGLKTNTPELKQSGQPTSVAALNSSRSNSSSTFLNTRQSASKKTAFLNWVNRQQCNLVNVTPSSGLLSNSRLTVSLLFNTSTTSTLSNTCLSWFLFKSWDLFIYFLVWASANNKKWLTLNLLELLLKLTQLINGWCLQIVMNDPMPRRQLHSFHLLLM